MFEDEDSDIEHLVHAEEERLRAEPVAIKTYRTIQYWIVSSIFRIGRVFLGLLLILFSLWCGTIALKIIHIPITSLTTLDVIKLVASVLGSLIGLVAALVTALGDGSTRPTVREQARINVSKNILNQFEQARALEERQQIANRWYSHGKYFGYLFEIITYLKRPWAWIFLVTIYYFVLFTFIAK